MTIFTSCFEEARRSWHLKIDIDKDQNISAWLIERGEPLGPNIRNQNYHIPHFSSVIFQI